MFLGVVWRLHQLNRGSPAHLFSHLPSNHPLNPSLVIAQRSHKFFEVSDSPWSAIGDSVCWEQTFSHQYEKVHTEFNVHQLVCTFLFTSLSIPPNSVHPNAKMLKGTILIKMEMFKLPLKRIFTLAVSLEVAVDFRHSWSQCHPRNTPSLKASFRL